MSLVSRLAAVLSVACVLAAVPFHAQTPVALPTTMTTIDSSSSQAARGGVVVDSNGNVFISDDVSGKLYLANQSTGKSSVFVGSASANCSGAVSSSGDGCPFASAKSAAGMRSVGIDPYGNVLLAGYGDNLVHILCRATSPLCTSGTASPSTSSPIQVQVGSMGLVAGCTTGGAGTKATGIDNAPGFLTASTTYSTSAFKTSTCTTTGTTYSPYGVTGDVYGNVYYSELGAAVGSERWRVVVGPSSYNGITNPIYAILAKNTAWSTITAGYAYTVADGNSSTTDNSKGNACATGITGWSTAGTATDAYGDGCLFTSSVEPGATSYASGVVVDAAGNMLYTDPGRGLRVLFVSDGTNFAAGTLGYIAGQAMKNAIYVNNKSFAGFTSAVPGYIYMLAGGGGTGISLTPTLGSSTTVSSTGMRRLAISPQGNVYMGVYSTTAANNAVYFFDITTGYVRILLVPGASDPTMGAYCNGSSGAKAIDSYGGGCPVSSSSGSSYATFANGNSSLPLAADGQGNLYIYDASTTSATTLVRKVLAQGMAAQTLGTTQVQSFSAHFYGATSATSTTTNSSNGDLSYGAPACTLRADASLDCTVTATVTPSAPGLRSSSLTVANASSGESFTLNTGAVVTGSVVAVDNASTTVSSTTTAIAPTTSSAFSSITPASVATDGAGNVYAANGTSVLESIGGTTYTLTPALTATPSQIAVDPTGDIFAVNSATPTIAELAVTASGTPSTYTATTLSYSNGSTSEPVAVAADRVGNVYVGDAATESVYRLSLAASTLQNQTTVATGFSTIASLAVDSSGNVYVADKPAGKVYKLAPGTTGTYTQTTLLTGVTPVAVSVDAAGDVYVQDSSSGDVLEVPVSGPSSVPVLTGLGNPAGVAVDGLGNVYSADATAGAVTKVVRDAVSYNFGTSESTTFAGTLTDVGTQASTAQNTSTSNTTNFAVLGGSSNGCAVSSNIVGAVAAGQACTLTAALTGNGTAQVNDYISFLPSASTAGVLTLTGQLLGNSFPTTTQTGTPGGSLTYAGSGTEASFTITVSASTATSAPTGSVNVYVDSTTAFTQYPLTAATSTSATAIVSLSGLHAGGHTIAAVYPTTGQFNGSGSPTTTASFSIAQAGTNTSWTPPTTTQMVSQAIGTSVLDATATTSDTSVSSVPGTFSYTYTPTGGGSATSLDASTYLPLGSYSLGVTFTPIDNVDYAASTASVSSYSVTQATTTAVAGASTNVVAADGSGNYNSLTAALSALPVTGGTVYLKPGTYTGQNAISYPNVQLRGLGGDATKVILTAEDGAFSSPFVYPGSGAGNANASGDQGSSTLDVTKSAYMGTTLGSTTYVPNNFYAEYLTIQNTYNTDTTTTTSYSTTSGSCASGSATHTLQYWYNAGMQCNSQALALWIESDQAVLNNVNLISQQDTLYAGSQGCGTYCTVARQYFWKGTITGDVDYVFGDAAMVFDHTNFFTTWHGTAATGTETIEAQNKKYQTGSSNDYLSGYICNVCTLMSQSTGMTNLYFGRPYGAYSTWIMLNSNVDQVNPLGWLEFSGDTNLPTSTYAEYNTQPYTDPAVGVAPYPASLFGGSLIPTGGNTGTGVTGTREVTSQDPGTLEAGNAIKTQLTAAQAAQYYPVPFLGTLVDSATLSAGQSATWNPVTALANAVNSFASTGNITLSSNSQSVTILGRPQTPGAGIIPTGSYAFYDSVSGAICTAVTSSCAQLASGSLDASGEAYLTTNSLAAGQTHTITMVYGGDTNFAGSTSTGFTITVPRAPLINTTTTLSVSNASSSYGGTIHGSVTVTPVSGTVNPTGVVTLLSGTTTLGSCSLASATGASSSCNFSLTGVAAGAQSMTASYASDGTFAASLSSAAAFSVARSVLQVTANNATMIAGGALPALTYSITGFVNGDTQATATTGAPALSTSATGTAVGEFPIAISTGTLAANNYVFSFTSGYLYVTSTSAAAPVATGDTRTVTEPTLPAVCMQLTANIADVNGDIPTSVDASNSNPDGARIQAALNSCSANSPGQAVELSMSGTSNDAFLTGPLTMPSNVTLLVDPGVVLYFSRNAQDYDKVAGTHTCGTVNSASATGSCQPLIDIPGTSTNVGIMGYGKLDGRGGDTLLNPIAPYSGYSWWGLSSAANGVGNQQNPRFIQMDGGSSNITLYKITIRNSPLFHVSTTGAVSGFTAWGVKIVTPTSSRNTDGIDPGNAQNFTITRSWISDGDDNVAVGAAGSSPAANISVTDNHFFAGHGESIGSYTSAGASNILFDGNMSAGNGFASHGSASITGTADSNSTAVRIKSANDRGGVVSNIQYSNSCFLDHKVDVQFTPYYSSGDSTSAFPNYNNILMQNLVFANDDSSTGTYELTGEFNSNIGGTPSPLINPLGITMDNVTVPSAFSSLVNSTTPVEAVGVWPNNNYSGGTGQYVSLIYGPGQVSTNFISAFSSLVANSANSDTVTNNITASSLNAPACSFTYIAPELTGPSGLPQSIIAGQNATAVVLLTPAVGGAAYPTGTVTLTDALTGGTTTVALTGTSDTVFVPLTGLTAGTHTFTATYSGDTNYPVPTGSSVYTTTGAYEVIVSSGSLEATTTGLSVTPSTTSYGNTVVATATVSGTNPTGTVQFVINGQVYSTQAVSSGSASASLSLPYSASAYSLIAIYSGDSVNAGSSSAATSITITQANTTTNIQASATSTSLGHPVSITATVAATLASAGTPTGTVSFSYSATSGGAQTSLGSASLSGGTASVSADLPQGTSYVQATFATSGSYLASTSMPLAITVNLPTIIPLSSNPIALPYTISNIAGGSGLAIPSSGNMACTGATDKYGDGCQGAAISLTSGDDLRAVVADPFGSVYFSDISAALVRKISPNGIVSNFAGKVSGTACVPTATVGCTPTLVSIGKARGLGSDASGNIYIANYTGNQVFEVKVSTGLMYLVAGNGTTGSTGDGGPATAAELNAPRGAWGDSVGDVYIAETGGNKIRVVDTTGNIHTFAGTGTAGSTGDGGPATAAEISNPQGVIADANLNVYIADSSNGRIRVVCVTCGTNSPLDALLAKFGIASAVNGDIYTIAGNGATTTFAYTGPVLATSVSMAAQKLAFDTAGNLYISDSNGFIWFLDFHTGYLRAIASNASTSCTAATDAYGDGCPATQAKMGSNGGNGFGVGVDTLGNMYISDSTDGLIRKVNTGLASAATNVGATQTQNVAIHFNAGDTPAASNALSASSTEWTFNTPACTTNADTTSDCLLKSSFQPALPGARFAPLSVNSTLGNSASLGLTGTGLGAGATLDPAKQMSFGSNLSVVGLATDNAGNIYVADANSKTLLRFAATAIAQGTAATSTTLASLTAPGPVAVDARGYAYVGDTSTGLITQVSPAGTASTLAATFKTPSGLAVDALGNLYVSDSSVPAIYQLNPITGAMRTLGVTGLVAPAGLGIDPSGNLLITDPGAPAVYRYNLSSGVMTTVTTPAVSPTAIATDAAGNLLIADSASILAVPASTHSSAFTVTAIAPSALAVDSAGDIYTGLNGGVLELVRTQAAGTFTVASTGPQGFTLLESGNRALTLSSIAQTDAADFTLAATASADCTVSSGLPTSLALGGICALSASYTPTTYASSTDTATLNGNLTNAALSTPSSVQLTLTGPPIATVTLGGLTQAFTGSPLAVTATTVPAGLTVNITYNGSATAPTAVGSYTVVATVSDATYVGQATGTLHITPANQLSVSATHSSATPPSPIFQAGPGIITLTVTNVGVATVGTATVVDTLDPSFTINSVPSACTLSGQAVTCSIAPGMTGSTSFQVFVTVSASASTTGITNTATLSDSIDGISNASSTDSIPVNPQAPQVDSYLGQIAQSGTANYTGLCSAQPGQPTMTVTVILQNSTATTTLTNPYATNITLTQGDTLISDSASSTSVGSGGYVTYTFEVLLNSCNKFKLFFDVASN